VIPIPINCIDHDRLFKELLETFFEEFLALFFPKICRELDLTGLRFLKQELFTDVTVGEKHQVDLLAEVGLKGEAGLILIHVENQAYFQPDFAERMYVYFSRIYQTYRRKILPIAVFSYDAPRDEPDGFMVGVPFLEVLHFKFFTVELKKRNWREYIHNNNPAAAALLSKMGYRPEEKVQVKLEFLRMLTKLQIDPARMTLLTGFFETYLKLNKDEEQILETELQKLPVEEARKMMEITTSWHEKGRREGLEEGKTEGKIEGKLEGKLEMAKNFLLMGLDATTVAKAAELPVEQILALQKSLSDKTIN
jgi:hypothetical protein